WETGSTLDVYPAGDYRPTVVGIGIPQSVRMAWPQHNRRSHNLNHSSHLRRETQTRPHPSATALLRITGGLVFPAGPPQVHQAQPTVSFLGDLLITPDPGKGHHRDEQETHVPQQWVNPTDQVFEAREGEHEAHRHCSHVVTIEMLRSGGAQSAGQRIKHSERGIENHRVR